MIYLADVVSVGPRVVWYHDGLLVIDVLMYAVVFGEADILILVYLFKCPVECGAQTVGSIVATLGITNACCSAFVVSIVDCHTLLVAVVGIGQDGTFVLCAGNVVIKQVVLFS